MQFGRIRSLLRATEGNNTRARSVAAKGTTQGRAETFLSRRTEPEPNSCSPSSSRRNSSTSTSCAWRDGCRHSSHGKSSRRSEHPRRRRPNTTKHRLGDTNEERLKTNDCDWLFSMNNFIGLRAMMFYARTEASRNGRENSGTGNSKRGVSNSLRRNETKTIVLFGS